MTPRKPDPTAKQMASQFVMKYPFYSLGAFITTLFLFGPEIKQIGTHYTGIHFSQDAVESTMILQKLDGDHAEEMAAISALQDEQREDIRRLNNLEDSRTYGHRHDFSSHPHKGDSIAKETK